MVVGPKMRWGTWEELILGGAVLRHGTDDWNVVASELRARTVYPNNFTPEACKARYEDLRKQYSGCKFWFEELRKRRIEELKQELERSEGSIGSLKSKIEILKAERERSGQAESPVPLVKSEAVELFQKEGSKDGLSAGSFTQNIRTDESHECQIPALTSATETDSKMEGSESCEREKVPSISKLACNKHGGTVKKRRGNRKRKDRVWDSKEGSIGESENVCSTSAASISPSKEASVGYDQTRRPSSVDNHKGSLCSVKNNGLMDVFNNIAQREPALVFRHRLDSQKRARYKKIIRRHMDMETIRSKLATLSIKSSVELFRDLLLLANNALVFYSKRTREYKAALALRDLVTKAYRQHQYRGPYTKTAFVLLPLPTICCPPVKPRSARPRPTKQRIPAMLQNSNNNNNKNAVPRSLEGLKRPSDPDSSPPLQSLVTAKKGFKQPGKAGKRASGNQVFRHRASEKEDSLHKTMSKGEMGSKPPVLKERKMTRQRLN
nr:bromodomain-containing protein 8-like isoform X4 [Ipomoea batatas]